MKQENTLDAKISHEQRRATVRRRLKVQDHIAAREIRAALFTPYVTSPR